MKPRNPKVYAKSGSGRRRKLANGPAILDHFPEVHLLFLSL
jgi:hypothetical protein